MRTNEWYTQPKYIEAAKEVMGSIELDPASCAEANAIVQAERYFTEQDNGLAQEWQAETVWLNPPYARTKTYQSGIRAWVEKALRAYDAGTIQQAILLVTTEMNAQWIQPLYQFSICFPNHRVKFISPKKDKRGKYQHMFGACFVYMGPNKVKFEEVFTQFGPVGFFKQRKPVNKPITPELWTSIV